MAKLALFFVLEKPTLPDNFGIKMSLPAIAPFYESIGRDGSVTKLNFSESTAYNFRFFRKPFQTDILVVVRDFDYHSSADLEAACRKDARGILEVAPNKTFDLEAQVQRALWLPKGVTRQEFNTLVSQFSKTSGVDPEHLVREDTDGGWMMSHPDGFLLGSKNESDFLRAAAFNALAMAYKQQSATSINRLSTVAATGGAQLAKLCEDVSRFQCQYAYQSPLETMKQSAHKEYKLLATHLGVPTLLDELKAKTNQGLCLLQSRLLSTGQVDDFGAQPSSQKAQASSAKPMVFKEAESKPVSRIMLAIVILGVAAAAFYFTSTDAGQRQMDDWLSQTSLPSFSSTKP